jgi:hypothetical protein
VGAGAAAAAAACSLRRSSRGWRTAATHAGEHRQQPYGAIVALRTRGRLAGLAHRATHLEGVVAGTAAELVERHARHRNHLLCLTVTVTRTAPMTIETIPRTEEVLETGEPASAHIVKTDPGENAAAKVLEARIYGTPLEALCGHVWVPSRDPKQLPICEKCKGIYEMYKAFNDGLNDQPDE